jgi:fatty acid amide hydrolase 2
MKLIELGAFEIAEQIKSKKVSPVDVVDAFIARAEKWNPKINAYVETFFEQARAEASAKEKQVMKAKKEDLPPLFGVPFSCKEMLAVEGAKRTAGSIYWKDNVSKETATVVQRYKDAGGILLGTTNVPELGFWFETENVVYGRTNNPHNLKHTSGGSSGGEGAIIAARGSAFGVGSDIGGSVRLPASFCGIFGHKPSPRTVPLTGHYPFTNKDMKSLTEEFYPYTVVGPLAHTAKDLYGLMEILSGADGIDPQTRKKVKLKPLRKDLKGLIVYSVASPTIFLSRRSEDAVVTAMNQATTYLSEIGCTVKPFPEDFFVGAVELWFKALKRTRQKSFAEHLKPSSPLSLKEEFFKYATFNANHTFPSLVMAGLEILSAKSSDNPEESARELMELKSRLNDYLGPDSVLLFPPHPRTAPSHHSPYFSPFDFIYAGIFNILDTPVTACPIGVDDQGLPTGVQIVANFDEDHLAISVAAALESAFGGAILPSGIPV